MMIVHMREYLNGSRDGDTKNLLTFALAFPYAAAHAGPKLGIARSSTDGGLSGYVSGKTLGIELSEGVGKGSNVHDVITGLRTFPIVEKPLVATGGFGEVDDVGSGVKEDPDGKEAEEDVIVLRASTLPKRVNKEHNAEKEDTRNMVWEGRQSRTMARALNVIIYAILLVSWADATGCWLLLGAAMISALNNLPCKRVSKHQRRDRKSVV